MPVGAVATGTRSGFHSRFLLVTFLGSELSTRDYEGFTEEGFMKRLLLALGMLCMIWTLPGCGGSGTRTFTEKQILSDETVDGEIVLDPVTGNLTVSQVARDQLLSVFAGVDPVSLEEYRAFIDFPLVDVIPGRASIESAKLDILIRSILPRNGSARLRIDLVSFPPPLISSDFDTTLQPALASVIVLPPIDSLDVGEHVVIDVTPLMHEAQVRGLPDFQVRVMQDPDAASPGLVEIDDSTSDTAPLLQVRYH
jgi:hypothetical protein